MPTTRRWFTSLLLLIAAVLAQADAQSLVVPEGGWRADPPFFSANNGKQRCSVVSIWLQSIRAEHARTYEGRNGDADMNNVRSDRLMVYSAPAFQAVFGKSFLELDKGERKRIASALKDCSKEDWVRVIMLRAFTLNPTWPEMRHWNAAFSRYESSAAARTQRPLTSEDSGPGNSELMARIPMGPIRAGDKGFYPGLFFDATGKWRGTLGCTYQRGRTTFKGRWALELNVFGGPTPHKNVDVSYRSLTGSTKGSYRGRLSFNSQTGELSLGFEGDAEYFKTVPIMLERGAPPDEVFSRFKFNNAWLGMDGDSVENFRSDLETCRIDDLTLKRDTPAPRSVSTAVKLTPELRQWIATFAEIRPAAHDCSTSRHCRLPLVIVRTH